MVSGVCSHVNLSYPASMVVDFIQVTVRDDGTLCHMCNINSTTTCSCTVKLAGKAIYRCIKGLFITFVQEIYVN